MQKFRASKNIHGMGLADAYRLMYIVKGVFSRDDENNWIEFYKEFSCNEMMTSRSKACDYYRKSIEVLFKNLGLEFIDF